MPARAYINALWVTIVIIAAIMVGVTAGLLAWRGGQRWPNATLTGGTAFSGAVVLMFVIRNELSLNSRVRGRQSEVPASVRVRTSSTGALGSGPLVRAILHQPQD
jgi:hypothetical protein